ncbi:MAG: hypothetical protein IJ501_01285 [Bacilli bacterium]|nr:hypothetical protein [Bacilli bacterium]
MNKKGFTTVELILTIVLVVIIMGTITSVTYTYRDRSEYEKLITEVTNYKNTLTKTIYDDLLNSTDPVKSISKLSDTSFKFLTENNREYILNILDDPDNSRIGINYDGIDYLFPGSSDDLVTFEGITYNEDNVNELYKLDINFKHRNLEDNYDIHLVIS